MPEYLGMMVPILITSYIAAAVCFYRHIYRTAPIMEEVVQDCKIYELFPAQEVKKAA